MNRRAFLGGALGAASIAGCRAQSTAARAQNAASSRSPGPLVWPVVAKLQPGIRSFAGHTNTVPDIVRCNEGGVPASAIKQ